jgi:hypothetical protein
MNKLQYAMGVSKKYSTRFRHLLRQKVGGAAMKMLTPAEFAQRGEGARPRMALKFKM